MLRVIAQASPQTRIEGRPASATAPRDRIAGFNARRRVEMWKSTNRISTFPRRTKKRIDWEWPLHRRNGREGRSEESVFWENPAEPTPLNLPSLFFLLLARGRSKHESRCSQDAGRCPAGGRSAVLFQDARDERGGGDGARRGSGGAGCRERGPGECQARLGALRAQDHRPARRGRRRRA